MFDLQIEDIESWIRGRGFTSVALQLPEGLKIRATELSDRILKIQAQQQLFWVIRVTGPATFLQAIRIMRRDSSISGIPPYRICLRTRM